MAFYVDIANPVSEYLRAELSPAAFDRLLAGIVAMLENCTDSFRDERRQPPGHSSYFHCTHIFPDQGRILAVRFVVNDSAAAFGVLRVVFADYDSFTPP